MKMLSLIKSKLSVNTKIGLRARRPSFFFRKKSYSQCGEDLLVTFLLRMMNGEGSIRYLDIGANHPFDLSNTALLYANGGGGIVVEPDPYFAELLRRARPRDLVLQCGVHFMGAQEAEFFMLDPPTLNTFSQDEMQRCVAMGHALRKTLKVKLLGINDILEQAGILDFLNVDVEGLDGEILRAMNWSKYRPKCICVETLSYERNAAGEKLSGLIDFVLAQDYILYADTYINTIFVDGRQWRLFADEKCAV